MTTALRDTTGRRAVTGDEAIGEPCHGWSVVTGTHTGDEPDELVSPVGVNSDLWLLVTAYDQAETARRAGVLLGPTVTEAVMVPALLRAAGALPLLRAGE